MSRCHSLCFVLLLLCATGCSSMPKMSLFEGSKTMPREKDDDRAVKCLCLWQEARGTGNGATMRGFAGQIYLFPARDASPVTVDGDVAVYLFDDHGTAEEQTQPLNVINIPASEWALMVKKTQFGPAYNVFVPYPREGNFEANCALRLRLTRKDGTRLFSDISSLTLAGAPRKKPDVNPGQRLIPEDSARRFVTDVREDLFDRQEPDNGFVIGMRTPGGQLRATPGTVTHAGGPMIEQQSFIEQQSHQTETNRSARPQGDLRNAEFRHRPSASQTRDDQPQEWFPESASSENQNPEAASEFDDREARIRELEAQLAELGAERAAQQSTPSVEDEREDGSRFR